MFNESGLDLEVIAQGQLNVPECEEPYETFVENALAKARHAARVTGLAAMADDSGLCVRALGGAPGVHSARFAGEPKNDQANNDLLIQKLAHHTDRSAHYMCVLVAVRHADDPEPLIVDGIWAGEIVSTPQGEGGFGYDPYFYIPSLQKTVASLTAQEKNARSHRGQALAELVQKLKTRWLA